MPYSCSGLLPFTTAMSTKPLESTSLSVRPSSFDTVKVIAAYFCALCAPKRKHSASGCCAVTLTALNVVLNTVRSAFCASTVMSTAAASEHSASAGTAKKLLSSTLCCTSEKVSSFV